MGTCAETGRTSDVYKRQAFSSSGILDGVLLLCNQISVVSSSRSFLSYFHIVLKRTGGTEPGRMVLGKGGLNEEHK